MDRRPEKDSSRALVESEEVAKRGIGDHRDGREDIDRDRRESRVGFAVLVMRQNGSRRERRGGAADRGCASRDRSVEVAAPEEAREKNSGGQRRGHCDDHHERRTEAQPKDV